MLQEKSVYFHPPDICIIENHGLWVILTPSMTTFSAVHLWVAFESFLRVSFINGEQEHNWKLTADPEAMTPFLASCYKEPNISHMEPEEVISCLHTEWLSVNQQKLCNARKKSNAQGRINRNEELI